MRNFNDIREGTNEASVDLLRKKLKKIKGITKDQIQVLATMPTPVLTSVINQLSMIVSDTSESKRTDGGTSFMFKTAADSKKFLAYAKDFRKAKAWTMNGLFFVDVYDVNKPVAIKLAKFQQQFWKEDVQENVAFAGNNSYVGQAQGELPKELEEAPLVASEITILDGILKKIKDDIIKDKLKGKIERSWPKMQQLAKLAGYNISKKMQSKGKTYRWDLKK